MDWRQIENDKEKYSAYLCSREWAEKREAVRERAHDQCERCQVLPMDACHHLSYERKYNESLDDLQAICTPCHEYTHGKSQFDPSQNSRFIHWLSICGYASANWLNHRWKEDFLPLTSTDERLLMVFHVWITMRFAWLAANDTVYEYRDFKNDDGDSVGENGAPPSDAELTYTRTLDSNGAAFGHG